MKNTKQLVKYSLSLKVAILTVIKLAKLIMSSSMASTMHLLTAVWYQFLVAPSLYRWDKAAVFLWLFRINATCLFFSTLDHIFAVSSPADDGSETIV